MLSLGNDSIKLALRPRPLGLLISSGDAVDESLDDRGYVAAASRINPTAPWLPMGLVFLDKVLLRGLKRVVTRLRTRFGDFSWGPVVVSTAALLLPAMSRSEDCLNGSAERRERKYMIER